MSLALFIGDTDNNNRVARAALLSAYRYRIGWEERATMNKASGGAFWQTPLDELERQLGASSNGLNFY